VRRRTASDISKSLALAEALGVIELKETHAALAYQPRRVDLNAVQHEAVASAVHAPAEQPKKPRRRATSVPMPLLLSLLPQADPLDRTPREPCILFGFGWLGGGVLGGTGSSSHDTSGGSICPRSHSALRRNPAGGSGGRYRGM